MNNIFGDSGRYRLRNASDAFILGSERMQKMLFQFDCCLPCVRDIQRAFWDPKLASHHLTKTGNFLQ